MYNIGDLVVYQKKVCKIKDIKEKFINENDYYILEPLNDPSLKLNVPTNDTLSVDKNEDSNKNNKLYIKIPPRFPEDKIEKNLENRFGEVEIEIIKSIGNNFSLSIKNILESFIDEDLREEIKDQFEKECRESPNYGMLQYENCQKLNEEGFIQAVWLMIYEGIRESKVALNDRKTH